MPELGPWTMTALGIFIFAMGYIVGAIDWKNFEMLPSPNGDKDGRRDI
jgi:hypothetical protein